MKGSNAMAKVTIYTLNFCPYCARAMTLFKSKGVPFTEINAGADAKKKQEMIKRSNGGSTFPQIFIGDTHIGGCDDLMALERKGALDAMLG